jgi:hypothetical protein
MCKNFRIGKNNEIKVFKTRLDRIFERDNHKICQKINETYFCHTNAKLTKDADQLGRNFVKLNDGRNVISHSLYGLRSFWGIFLLRCKIERWRGGKRTC